MNEFAAEVTGPGEVSVNGHRLGAPGAGGFGTGSALSMLVRPEDLSLGEGGLPGTVTSVTFQGATTLIGVRLDVLDQLVSADIGQGAADHLQLGDRVSVLVNGANAVCEPA
jgi:ABC-type Fe3+/spermidine/putrescine transport system ATPase subunit